MYDKKYGINFIEISDAIYMCMLLTYPESG